MDSDSSTAVAKRFQDRSSVLAADPERATEYTAKAMEPMLYMFFQPEELGFTLQAFDPELGVKANTILDVRGPDFSGAAEQVEDFLGSIESRYELEVPPEYRELAMEFMELMPRGIAIAVEAQHFDENGEEYFDECDYCGFNSEYLQCYYFPPFDDGGEASLGFEWHYGCYNSFSFAGNPEEVGAQVMEHLERASVENHSEELESFRAQLRRRLKEAD